MGRMEYFMHHTYEPKKSAMTFHLDYDRLSDFADTVGYWYVEKLSDGWSRVYYSTDSTLPGWIPAFARSSWWGWRSSGRRGGGMSSAEKPQARGAPKNDGSIAENSHCSRSSSQRRGSLSLCRADCQQDHVCECGGVWVWVGVRSKRLSVNILNATATKIVTQVIL